MGTCLGRIVGLADGCALGDRPAIESGALEEAVGVQAARRANVAPTATERRGGRIVLTRMTIPLARAGEKPQRVPEPPPT
jgi:hypothetical protein